MRTTLALTQQHHLCVTPQLQQAIRLLQLSNQSLVIEIESALAQNPFLELESEPEVTHCDLSEHSYPSNISFENKLNFEYEEWLSNRENEVTLHQHLLWQLSMGSFTKREQDLGMLIIDAINEDGYLLCSLKEIQENYKQLLPDQEQFSINEIETVLHKIQHFDPLGVGARNLIECLLLQLFSFPKGSPLLREAIHAVQYLELIAKSDFQSLKKKMKWDDTMLQSVLKILKALTPKPGQTWLSRPHISDYVIPDLLLRKKNGAFVVQLNMANIPRVKINTDYVSWMKRADANTKNLLKEQFQNAKHFLHGIRTRNETLLLVAKTIIDYQQNFFLKGTEYLMPLKLQQISEKCNLHESTISRITTEKFIDTPRGSFELKYFFSNSVGTEKSAKAIQAWIKKILRQENKNNPFTDQDITNLLIQEGIKINRRTVTKYREKMKIPSSHDRRTLKASLNPMAK